MDRYWLNVNSFAGLPVITIADFLQLPTVRGKLIFSQFSDKDVMKHLIGSQLWHLFEYTELNEVVIQNYKVFIDLLNSVWVGNIGDDVENLLKARFIHESNENYPKDTLQMYAENESAVKKKMKLL